MQVKTKTKVEERAKEGREKNMDKWFSLNFTFALVLTSACFIFFLIFTRSDV